jgi:hypothetical protein
MGTLPEVKLALMGSLAADANLFNTRAGLPICATAVTSLDHTKHSCPTQREFPCEIWDGGIWGGWQRMKAIALSS